MHKKIVWGFLAFGFALLMAIGMYWFSEGGRGKSTPDQEPVQRQAEVKPYGQASQQPTPSQVEASRALAPEVLSDPEVVRRLRESIAESKRKVLGEKIREALKNLPPPPSPEELAKRREESQRMKEERKKALMTPPQ